MAKVIAQSYRLGSKTGGADMLAADLSHSNSASRAYMGVLVISFATAGIPSVVYNNGESDEEIVVLNNNATLTGMGVFKIALPIGKTLNFRTSVTGDVDVLEVYEAPVEDVA